MAEKPETVFTRKALIKLRAIRGSYFVKIQQVALRGVPDILGCVRGHFVALEIKVPPNKVRDGSLQQKVLRDIDDAGGFAAEVTPENLDAVIKELSGLYTPLPGARNG